MTALAQIKAALAGHALTVLGGFQAVPEDALPPGPRSRNGRTAHLIRSTAGRAA